MGKIGVTPGNVDKHRHSMSGLKVEEESKWGFSKARELTKGYEGSPAGYSNMRPQDRSEPQDPEAKRGPDWADDVGNDWRRGFGKNSNESAEGKPGYVSGFKGKR